MLQRGRGVRGDDDDEGGAAPYGQGALDSARHLQVLMRDRRAILPLRPADLLHEVWLLEL